MSVAVDVADEETIAKQQTGGCSVDSISLVAPKDEYETQDDMIRRLVSNASEGCSLVVVQSYMQALLHAKRLFGDDRYVDERKDICLIVK